jgi:hypothetical protein
VEGSEAAEAAEEAVTVVEVVDVMKVGTRWTLPLTATILRLPFLADSYCSRVIVLLALLFSPLSSSGLLFFACYCFHHLLFQFSLLFSLFW